MQCGLRGGRCSEKREMVVSAQWSPSAIRGVAQTAESHGYVGSMDAHLDFGRRWRVWGQVALRGGGGLQDDAA